MSFDYKKAGVDIAAGESLVNWLKESSPKAMPHQDKVISGIGGFASLFKADFSHMEEPCLVSSTDGVGTKLKMAIHFESYQGVGQDLVAMCVNDLLCCGAQPLFFLDYYSCGRLDLTAAKDFLSGLQAACVEADCALIGGETAEMPGLYQGKDFDCAGFSVGVVDKVKALGAHRVKMGDRLIGVASSGYHSNGFSLIRPLFEKDLLAHKEELLRPTHLYSKMIKSLMLELGGELHSVANITGGGLDNLPRVLPDGAWAKLNTWEIPDQFKEVKRRADMDWHSLLTTLNSGLGMILVVQEDTLGKGMELVRTSGFNAFDLGTVEALASTGFKKSEIGMRPEDCKKGWVLDIGDWSE